MESLRSKSDPSERVSLKEKLISLHSARDSFAAEDIVDKFLPGKEAVEKQVFIAMVRDGIGVGNSGPRSIFHSFWGEMVDRIQEKQIEFGDSWKACDLLVLMDRMETSIAEMRALYSVSPKSKLLEETLIDVANMSMLYWLRLTRPNGR